MFSPLTRPTSWLPPSLSDLSHFSFLYLHLLVTVYTNALSHIRVSPHYIVGTPSDHGRSTQISVQMESEQHHGPWTHVLSMLLGCHVFQWVIQVPPRNDISSFWVFCSKLFCRVYDVQEIIWVCGSMASSMFAEIDSHIVRCTLKGPYNCSSGVD
jgi:hypothetical protein